MIGKQSDFYLSDREVKVVMEGDDDDSSALLASAMHFTQRWLRQGFMLLRSAAPPAGPKQEPRPESRAAARIKSRAEEAPPESRAAARL